MANRNFFPLAGSNHPGMVAVSGRFTFAADVDADGCAVTLSNGYITSCAKTAEGIFTVTFVDSYKYCFGVMPSVLTVNVNMKMTAQSLDDSSPTVTLTFETGSTGADIDPDSLVTDLTFFMKNSTAANGA